MPAAQNREQEAKFEVTPNLLPKLQAQTFSLQNYTRRQVGTLTQTDSYLDTQAYDLLRHGLVLRVRAKGDAHEIGIKSLQTKRKGAIQDRLDVAIPLPPRAKPFDPSTWPDAVQEQLEEYPVALEDLRLLVTIHQKREKSHLLATGQLTDQLTDQSTGQDNPLAEWSLDEVWIGEENGAEGPNPPHFHELEIELLAPERASAFATLVADVQKQFKLKPVYTSKLVRGLEAAILQTHNGDHALTAEMELPAASRLLLHQQLLQMMLNEEGVRNSKKPRYVHDMRVAIRRARAILLLFGHAFHADALKPYAKGLKRLGRVLGAVRDVDVALENLRTFRRDQPKTQADGLKPLRDELKKRRAHAHTELVTLLNSKKQRKFIATFDAFCASSASDALKAHMGGDEYHPSQVRHTLPSIMLGIFESIRAYELAFTNNQIPAPETFHALRIQSKYLRYCLEFTQHLLNADGESLIAQTKELQEELGQLNDAHVEQARLHHWQEQLEGDDELRTAIEERLNELSTRIDSLSATIPAHFASFISLAQRIKLATALAHL